MAEVFGHEPQYRTVRQTGFRGVVDGIDDSLIEDSESPVAYNFEYDKGTLSTTRGCRKFNNQTAPSSGIRTRAPEALPPLYIASGLSVPLRGSVYYPYDKNYDIGGLPDYEGTFPSSDTFHNRRGHSFRFKISFEVPIEERLYEAESRGAGAPAAGAEDTTFAPPHGYDEGFEETFCIVQKGGDRTAPMSWALAVVNVGKLVTGDGSGTSLPLTRPSNYALVFMWLDVAQWGEITPNQMMYALASGVAPTSTSYSTQAYRAVLLHKFIEPGKRYTVSPQLQMDSGTGGGIADNTEWNNDGVFSVHVQEEGGEIETFSAAQSGTSVTLTGMEVWKGPQDSAEYLLKYGIRFFGRDAMHGGLGFRFVPWREGGFIPYGADLTSLEHQGFRMADRSSLTVAAMYPTTAYTLTVTKAALGDAFVTLNEAGFSFGDLCIGRDPAGVLGASYSTWIGLGDNIAAPFNAEALRGYRLVATADFTAGTPDAKGMILNILSYTRVGAGGPYQVTISAGSTIGAFGAIPLLLQCFRWHQRDLFIQDFSIGSAVQDITGDTLLASRRRLSFQRSIRLDDQTEPDLDTLLAYWPMDDGGGTVLAEKVIGGYRNAQLCPQGMGVSGGGERSTEQLFLSGEGEALCLDLSENSVIEREMAAVLRGSAQGFAVEISCVFTEAFYGIQTVAGPSGSSLAGARASFVPDIVTIDVANAETSGQQSQPRTLLNLTCRPCFHDPGTVKFKRPAGFGVEVAVSSDQENLGPVALPDLLPWYLGAAATETPRFSQDAPWVGKKVTMQVGVQSTGTPDQYDVYLAMSPKDAFMPAAGDPGDAEFTHWTSGGVTYDASVSGYYTAAHVTLTRKDLARTIITIGGRLTPGGLGYCELSARMLVDEVRVFSTCGPGALPSATGGIVASRDGKLEGSKCLPPRVLSLSDLRRTLGNGVDAVNATEGSVTITPARSGGVYTSEARTTIESVKDGLLQISGDEAIIPDDETIFVRQPDFQRVVSAAADGSSLTLASGYRHASRSRARAVMLPLLGYTDISGGVPDRFLSAGASAVYNPATSTSASIVYTEQVLSNLSPTGAVWKMRVFPLGVPLKDVLPQWARGVVVPRRGKTGEGVLGVTSVNGKVYAAVRGALYECDDRWEDDGPSDAIQHRLRVRGSMEESVAGLSIPTQADRVEFEDYSGALMNHGISDAQVTVIDTWLRLDELGEYQTVFWIGSTETDPSLFVGLGSRLNLLYMIVRMARGKPELVIGSSSYYTGTTKPEKGLFVATGSILVGRGSDVHVRWYMRTGGGGTILKIPHLKVNGHSVEVTVNARDSLVIGADDWLPIAVGSAGPDPNVRLVVGAARDSYRSASASGTATSGGAWLRPQRIQGYIHSLAGAVSEIVVSKEPIWTGTAPGDFDPLALDYGGSTVQWRILGGASEGRGAKVREQVGGSYGIIRSHPFISLYHELGTSDDPVSFARYGEQLYATNGARPALIQNGAGKKAGVLPPTAAPTFTLKRFSIWKENRRTATSADPDNDPVAGAVAGAAVQVYHYRGDGNCALIGGAASAEASQISWDQNDMFHFKCDMRLDAVTGKINIARKGSSAKSGGPFIEVRDGFLYVGWYDTTLKDEVSLHTSVPVIIPGETYYLYFRKQWAPQDLLSGNWNNSFATNGAIRRMVVTGMAGGSFAVGDVLRNGAVTKLGRVTKAYVLSGTSQTVEFIWISGAEFAAELINNGGGVSGTTPATASIYRPMHDVLVLARLARTSKATTLLDLLERNATRTSWVVGAGEDATVPTTPSRLCVSLTTSYAQEPGTTMSGQVSYPGNVYTGFAGGLIAGGTSTGAWTTPDMCGMYFQFGSGPFIGIVYRIVNVPSAFGVNVVDSTGAVPNLAASVNDRGGVFCGVTLVKSANFDSSKTPHNETTPGGNAPVMIAGSDMDRDPLTGYAPFVGDMWCPGYGVTALTANGEDARCFENLDTTRATGAATADPIYVGTDTLRFDLFNGAGGAPGQLRGNNLRQFWATDFRLYDATVDGVSSQPVNPPIVPADTSPTCVATNASQHKWVYLQDPAVWQQTMWVAQTFYDPDQGISSNPGPSLRIKPATEDLTNQAGSVRALVSGLSASRDTGELETHIFKSVSSTNPDGTLLEAGSSAVQQRVSILDDGTADVAIQTLDNRLAEQPLLEFDNGPPPACRVLAVSQGSLFYGGLTDDNQLDGIQYSKAFIPAQVPASNFFRVNSGPGTEITGMVEFDGNLIVLSREAVFSSKLNAQGLPQQDAVSSGAGCVAHQSVLGIDQQAVWLGDRGLYTFSRSQSAAALGQAMWTGQRLAGFFTEGVDRRYASRASATLNRPRWQYVVAFRGVGDVLTRRRVSMMGDVFGLYRDPNVTAMASLQPKAGGPPRIVGGTEEGFMVWLDDPSTQYLLHSGDQAADGDVSMAVTAASGASVEASAADLDLDLEGARGSVLRWQTPSGVQEATVLGAEGEAIHLDRLPAVLPISTAAATLGEQSHQWESKWFDFGDAEKRKRHWYLDLEFSPGSSGRVDVLLYTDRDATQVKQRQVSLDTSVVRFQLPLKTYSPWIKAVVRSTPLSPGGSWDIIGLTWRVIESDQH